MAIITINSTDQQLASSSSDDILRGLLAEIDNLTLDTIKPTADLFVRVAELLPSAYGAVVGLALWDSFCGKVAKVVLSADPRPQPDPRREVFPMLKFYSALYQKHGFSEEWPERKEEV
jgi:hypothetical protein